MFTSNSNIKLSLSLTGGAVWTGNLIACKMLSCSAAPGFLSPLKMQNNVLNLTTQAIGSGSLTIDVRKTLPTSNAVKPVFNVYYIEDAMITGELVNVEFSLDDKWHTMTVELQALLNFALDAGLNNYCFDSANYTGEHSQEYGSFDIDTYVDENIVFVVKAYLQSIKARQISLN